MGGYNPNPPSDDDNRPTTRAEADAQNKVGRQNREERGLDGYGGYSSEQLDYVNQQTAQRKQEEQQSRINQQRERAQQEDYSGGAVWRDSQGRARAQQRNYEQEALLAAEGRPGFANLATLGDASTQQKAKALMEKTGASYSLAVGETLESQRLQAITDTPNDTRDDQFFANELSKWKQNKVELGSSFHFVTRDATDVKENPYELQADLAVESLKGSPNKRSEVFSPVSGKMSPYLPGDRGLQETMWDTARDRKTPSGSYMDAIRVLERSSGGLVTGKMGSVNRPSGNPFNGGSGSGPSDPSGGAMWTNRQVGEVRTETIAPTGEVDLFGLKFNVPGLGTFRDRVLQEGTVKRSFDVSQEENSPQRNIAGKELFGIKLATSMGSFESAEWLPSKGTAKLGDPTYGEIKSKGDPKVSTRFNPATGETETLTEQAYEQESFQNYLTYDDSKQVYPQTITSFTPKESRFERTQRQASEKIQTFLPTGTLGVLTAQEKMFGAMAESSPTPVNLAMAIGASEMKTAVKEPFMAGVSYGVGLGFGGGTRAVSAGWRRALPVITNAAPRTAKALGITGKAVPYVLTGMYGVDVASRSTSGFTDYKPVSIMQKAVPIATFETLPLGFGFSQGYRIPETARSGYEYAKTVPASARSFAESTGTKLQGARSSLPTIDQIKYKWVELRTPSTAMSTPMASERFTVARRPGITGSGNKWVDANRIAARSSGTRAKADRGTVSGRPTPRQESLRLNYNPTAPLTEINSNLGTSSRTKGLLSGIRGTLRGKWDSASATMDEFAHLPLKERWKARTAAKEPSGSKGYFGGGKPAGGLQSGVGAGGTTVRSGRQVSEVRMPSSGVSAEIESFAPQRLEIIPSRRTAQRSRAYDYEFEYEGKSLPGSMSRPKPAQSNDIMQRAAQESEQGVKLSPRFDIVSQQGSTQKQFQDQVLKSRLFTGSRTSTKESVVQDQRRGVATIPLVTPVLKSGLDILSVQSPALITGQRQRLKQVPVPFTETRATSITRPTTTRDRRTGTDFITTVTPKPEVPKIPGMWFPDAGGSSGDRPRMRMGVEGWTNINPVADIGYLSKGMTGDPFSGGGSSSGGAFGAKCRHTSAKLRKKCSRFQRNG